ncbi:MAG: DNA-protecting protein DprA [Rhodospirillales bacterium]|nr:DNA-processing protein DprA [Alphaproteobacteria bacterium]MCB9986841.1 DNA-protecting protein DprA [Rhodospirillales bacterium]USO08396.1 MAG: DNA-protecting protein DprA [Rhodospirillales bacterium]
MLPQAERTARLRLARSEGIGPITFRRLLERYGSGSRAVQAVPELAKRGGRGKPLSLCPASKAEDEIAAIEKRRGALIVWGDPDYPAPLAAIEDAPPVLTMLGRTDLVKKTGIGIVGARNASLQGRRFTETLAAELGRAGLAVISGLARGIDTAAHAASLSTGTIAVVAGGVDVVYPTENQTLYERICDQGALVAENALGTQPMAQHFPRRNRIISGLARGVCVVEATIKSGSLITAHCAADQGREVYAVPGHPLDPRAGGPNSLIRDGAMLVTGAADILDSLARLRETRIVREPASALADFGAGEPDAAILESAREHVLSLLGTLPVPVDDLIRETAIPASVVQTVLLELELAGRLTRHPQNRVSMPYIEYAVDKSGTLL